MADYKEHSPIEEEPRMPERESSLDDFEKLENFCIQDKTDDLLPQDILGSLSSKDLPSSLSSKDQPINQPLIHDNNVVDDLLGLGSDYANKSDDLLGDFTNEFKIGEIQKRFDKPPPYEEPSFAADYMKHVAESRPTERLLQFEEDLVPRQFHEAKEKLVHPQSDSGYIPSPVEESAEIEKYEEPAERVVLPSAPKIASLEPRKDEEKESQLTGPSSKGQRQKSPVMTTEEKKTSGSAGGCPFSFSALFDPNRLNPCVTNLVYWRDPKKSGIVFGVSLLFLLSLRYFSLITVVSYLALAVISITLSFRIYKNILQAVQKSTDGHPFKEYLDQDVSFPQETVHEAAEKIVDHLKCTVLKLRSLFLVEDLIDSIKLGIVLWCLTYLGAWFNGLTLITLGFIAAFSLPKVYETNKAQIDQYIGLVSTQVSGVVQAVKSKIPFGQKEKAQ